MALSISFRSSVSFPPVTQATGLLTLAPVGFFFSPTEHASLRWTHALRSPFPSKAGRVSGGHCRHICWRSAGGARRAVFAESRESPFLPATFGRAGALSLTDCGVDHR